MEKLKARCRNLMRRLRLILGHRRLRRWSKRMRRYLKMMQTVDVLEETDSLMKQKVRVELMPRLKLKTTQPMYQWIKSTLEEMILVTENLEQQFKTLSSPKKK